MLNLTQNPNRILQKKSTCHWNLNNIAAHNFAKLVLLKAYNSVHKFNIICLSETYLYSNILPDDSNLEIAGYTLVHSDINYLNEHVRFEIMVGGKLCNFIALYRSPRSIRIF